MIAFDTSILGPALLPEKLSLVDLDTKEDVHDAPERFAYMIETLERNKEKIIIPAPVLNEILTLSVLDFSS